MGDSEEEVSSPRPLPLPGPPSARMAAACRRLFLRRPDPEDMDDEGEEEQHAREADEGEAEKAESPSLLLPLLLLYMEAVASPRRSPLLRWHRREKFPALEEDDEGEDFLRLPRPPRLRFLPPLPPLLRPESPPTGFFLAKS